NRAAPAGAAALAQRRVHDGAEQATVGAAGRRLARRSCRRDDEPHRADPLRRRGGDAVERRREFRDGRRRRRGLPRAGQADDRAHSRRRRRAGGEPPEDFGAAAALRLDACRRQWRGICRSDADRFARVTAMQPIVAIATGDPAGIGPELSLKTALDDRVRGVCRPLLVGDPDVVARQAKACGIGADIRSVERVGDVSDANGAVSLLAVPAPDAAKIEFGANSAASGRASLAAASRAIKAALAGEVDAVVAAPQNQTSIALAGIEFDGYPSFVARETDLEPDDVYLMLCFGEY